MYFKLISKRYILDYPELKELEDDNSKSNKHYGKFSKTVENTMGKGEIAASFARTFLKLLFTSVATADQYLGTLIHITSK